MNQYTADVLTVLVSVVLSVFTAGFSMGQTKSEMRAITDRLARIEAMFTLTLRGGNNNEEHR